MSNEKQRVREGDQRDRGRERERVRERNGKIKEKNRTSRKSEKID